MMNGQTIKLDLGTVYRKQDGGVWYFRYQINGQRKAVSLKVKFFQIFLRTFRSERIFRSSGWIPEYWRS